MKILITADLREPHKKYINVDYYIDGLENQRELVLGFPVWSPGSYLIREFQSQVESVSAVNEKNRKISFKKINKCQWKFDTKNSKKIKLSYRVYANDLSVRGLYADHRLVFFNPSSLFFITENFSSQSVKLKIVYPKKWKLIYQPRLKNQTALFKNFDDLLDAPLLCAEKIDVEYFTTNKTRYTLALWGDYSALSTTIKNDLKKIVNKENIMFGDNPCKHYVFQVLFFPDAYGGLEHSFSSSNIYDGSLLVDPKSYRHFLSLLSHEHFHLWNVKRIRPRELGPFDYFNENYTLDLWMAEGITSYYDDHYLYRADIYNVDQYLEILATNITSYLTRKSFKTNSLSDSSFDAWIKFYRQNENSPNVIMSYYLKGGLIMMLLDFLILKKSKTGKNLDDVMKKLYKLYKKRPEKGFTRDEFFKTVEEVCEINTKTFVKDYIDGLKPVDWKKEFKHFGISLKQEKSEMRYFGIVLEFINKRLIIKSINEDSPAYLSQLQVKDEIISIDNEVVIDEKAVNKHLKKRSFEVLFTRHNHVFKTVVKTGEPQVIAYKLSADKKLNNSQKKFQKAFLRKS